MNSCSCFEKIFGLFTEWALCTSSFSSIFTSSSFNSTLLSSSSKSEVFSIFFSSSSDSLSISLTPSIKFFSFFSFFGSFFFGIFFFWLELWIFILSIENLNPSNSNAKYFVISSLTKNIFNNI